MIFFILQKKGYTKTWFNKNRRSIVTRKDEKFLAKQSFNVLYHIFKFLVKHYNDIFEVFDIFVDTRLTFC